MELSLILRLAGVVLILIGIVLVSNPELVTNKPVPSDTFEAIERRIWWGLFIGLGCLLMFHHQVQPWQMTVAATGASLLFGLLAARLIGIGLDGSLPKQWLLVGVELIIMLPFIWWYFKARG